MPTNTKENGFETIIVNYLRDRHGYAQRHSDDFNKELALDCDMLEAFLTESQPEKVAACACFASPLAKQKFFKRLTDELDKRGVTDVLRNGFRYINVVFDMSYPVAHELSVEGKRLFALNRFEVIRQLHFSPLNPELSIDVVLFINGMPIVTMELKNQWTKQDYTKAIAQYKKDRDPKVPLLHHKRCAVHLAIDDNECWMCTKLDGKNSRFLPFNKGNNGGKGNPVNPNGLRTAYVWEEVLAPEVLMTIISHYAQVIKKGSGEMAIWPRYHQFDCVRALLADTKSSKIGKRYLIKHSAGSGKSNTITWLAFQLVTLFQNGVPLLDSVVVVTDSVNLDKQIRDNITAFNRIKGLIAWADHSGSLRDSLKAGKKIIITTLHKFPYIIDEIGGELRAKQFAVIIDEAHSSQSGAMAADMSRTLAGLGISEDDDFEEKMEKLMKGRRLPDNVNYYAFTATPKNKTLTMFGTKQSAPDGRVESVPFHEYTMKQAIEEGFIHDVLRNYTCYQSFYNIVKATGDDPEYAKSEAQKKLRAYVERQPETIRAKAAIIVEHFCTRVSQKIGGKARAMVVASSIVKAIDYYYAIRQLLIERHSPYKVLIAFSGDKEYNGSVVTEEGINGFPQSQTPAMMKEAQNRILVVANKYQTGYDEPLLHTMYVDKQLSGVKAVQTLSRLNRTMPDKKDTFVLDFYNEDGIIKQAFQEAYKGIKLTDDPDPNRLNDLLMTAESGNFYGWTDVEEFNRLYWGGADREDIDPMLDRISDFFKQLDVEVQVKCKSAMKAFCRAYTFFAAVLPFSSAEWEQTYHFFLFLLPKLPKLQRVDDDDEIVENVEFDKYRIVKGNEHNIYLADDDAELDPVTAGVGAVAEDEKEYLSKIIDDFNTRFGTDWVNADKVKHQFKELTEKASQNISVRNAILNSDRQTAHLQFCQTMMLMMAQMMKEDTELPGRYMDNTEFRNSFNAAAFADVFERVMNA